MLVRKIGMTILMENHILMNKPMDSMDLLLILTLMFIIVMVIGRLGLWPSLGTDESETVSDGWLIDYANGRNYLRRTVTTDGEYRSMTSRPPDNPKRYTEEVKRA